MKTLCSMDWNAKWEWEKWVMFNSKAFKRPEKLSADWEIGEGEIDNWSFNLSGGGGGGGGGRSQSSLRSSISASTDSSSKELFKISPLQDYSIGSGDQSISLKLGKRTYFENNSTGCNSKTTSLSGNPVSSITSTAKNIKSVCQRRPPCCQVEGCNLDLSSAKEYHRKHRVCESHSKCPKVVIGGLERRFCQQCSRFHGLSEFDEKKRSCRRRLSNHNARRRKPQQAIHFNSTRFSSPFSDQTHYTSFIRNCPLVHTSSCINSSWESTCKSDLTLTKGYMSKSGKTGGVDGQLQVPGTDMSLAIGMVGQNSHGLFPCKGSEAEVSTQGLKEPILSPNLNAAPNFQSALSLLSTNSWVLEPTSLDYPSIHSSPTNVPQTSIYTVFQGLPLISSDSQHLHTITTSYGFHSHM